MAGDAMTADAPAETVAARVVAYYDGMGLVERIEEDLERGGFDRGNPSADGPRLYGSFHVGGAEAVERLLDAMPPLDGRTVLDIGCGVGGAVRALARRGAMARGIDVTPAFVAVARSISRMVGGDTDAFAVADACALPYVEAAFDHAIMLHVGMNIADKRRAMAEAARVIRPGGIFAIYDFMRVGSGEVADALPWGEAGRTSFVEPPEAYLAAAEGFIETARVARPEEAVAFVEPLVGPTPPRPISDQMRRRLVALIAATRAGALAPVEMILTRRG